MADFPLDLEVGFIALPRGLLESQAYRALTVGARAVLLTVLERAQFRPGVVWVGSRRIELAPGQLLDSEEALAKRSGTTRKVTRSALARLEVGGFLVRRPVLQEGQHAGRCPHIISVCEYAKLATKRGAEAPLEGLQEVPQEGQFGANSGPIRGQFGAPSEEREPGNQVNHVNQKTFGAPPARPVVATKAPSVDALKVALVAAYFEIRGEKYRHSGPKDTQALRRLLADAEPAEIERRWRLALVASGFHRCDSFAQLAMQEKWAHFGSSAPGLAMAPAAPAADFVPGPVKL